MGSGLILLVIVGAWLVFLVPMVLRNTDVSGSLGSVDKFHDAMRVLSRRSSSGSSDEVDDAVEEPAPGRLRTRLAALRDRPPLTAAARRRRVLLVLVVLALGTLVGVVLGPLWLLAPHLVADLLLVAFLGYLRRTAAARADREMRTAMGARRPAARPAAARPAAARPPARPAAQETSHVVVTASRPAAPTRRLPVHVAGIPDRMPARPLPLAAPSVEPVAVPEEVPAARGAQGEAWSPVPVPAPTYLSAPTAPRTAADLSRAGTRADGVADAERELGIVDDGPQLDEILDRRRAVNDW